MPRRLLVLAIALALAAVLTEPVGSRTSPQTLANRCIAVKAAAGAAHAEALYFKPTGLGTYLLSDRQGKLLEPGRPARRVAEAGPRAQWRPLAAGGGSSFSIRSTATAQPLSLGGSTRFTLTPATGCRPFPEAEVGATGIPFSGIRRNGTVFGFVDAHLHITANMRAGGLVISGEPFDRFGIPAALGRDAGVHGSDGRLDYTGNLLRDGNPVGTHDTHGWPTFRGWPVYNTQTHQQTYYVWLQRAYAAGERLVVAQTVDDQALCRLEPRHRSGCDETASIEAQIKTLRAMQDYVDAQNGGAGRGWFRLVYSPAQARAVIARGKLAVVIGIESSDLFGCSVQNGKSNCSRARIDRGLRTYGRLGVRGMFVAHWVDNPFAGAALEDGAKGIFINILNRLQTGAYFKTGSCPGVGQGVHVLTLPASVLESLTRFFPAAKSIAARGMPMYPSGLQCNRVGLSSLGRFLIKRMIAAHMLIEVDHLSERARDTVLSIAEHAHYPLVSSHNGTGGEWTAAELTRLYRLGGFAAVTPDQAPALAAKINRMASFRDRGRFFGVGLGTDTGGFASLPGPRPDAAAHPFRYPFKSYDGKMKFVRQRTGRRTFDLNRDGVAHYGLLADLLADTQRAPGGSRALSLLFGSAEAYLEMWGRAVRH